VAPVDKPGADCGDSASVSSKNGLVDRGRSGRALVAEPGTVEGERARFRKGLLEPKLAAVGETWLPVPQNCVTGQFHVTVTLCRRGTGLILSVLDKDPRSTQNEQSEGVHKDSFDVTYLVPATRRADTRALEGHSWRDETEGVERVMACVDRVVRCRTSTGVRRRG
jgi:hypothetical protein